MAERYPQNCVLCGRPSEYCFADYEKRKHFFCGHCTEYQITDTAESKLDSAPEGWRTQCSDKARSLGPDIVLSIFVPPGGRNADSAYESLRAEPTARNELPPCR